MVLGNPVKPSHFERIKWQNVSSEYSGKIVSLDGLKKIFPADEKYSEVEVLREEDNYVVYGRKYKAIKKPSFLLEDFIAYHCNFCSELIIGPPKIVDDLSIRNGIPLSGRKGYDIYCRNCGSRLYEHTIAVSFAEGL